MSAQWNAGRPQGPSGPASGGQGPAWRGTGGTARAGGTASGWKSAPPSPTDAEARGRMVRAAVALAALLLLAAFGYYLFLRPRPTPLILWTPEAYPLQMPPLAFAQEDAERLRHVNPLNLRATAVPLRSRQSLEDLKVALQKASRDGGWLGFGKSAVLVYVAAHGQVNERGDACLVPPQADPFDSTTWLPLSELVDAMSQALHPSQQFGLLILDAPRVESSWRCGWLESRWYDRVSALLAERHDSRLWVLTAAGQGQVAWAAPELRGSVFGHFLARGLQGEADPRSGQITLASLFDYLATHVDAYVQRRRAASQQPQLWYQGQVLAMGASPPSKPLRDTMAGLRVAYVDAARRRQPLESLYQPADPVAAARRLAGLDRSAQAAPAATLAQAWQLYQSRCRPAPAAAAASGSSSTLAAWCVDPVALASVQQRLAAIGQRLTAGMAYQGPDLEAAIRQLQSELADDRLWQPRGRVPVVSAAAAGSHDPRATAELAARWLAAYPMTEREKQRALVPPGVTSDALLAAVYGAFEQGLVPPEPDRLATALELLALVPPAGPEELRLERQMLTLLARRPLPDASGWGEVLGLRPLAERAAVPVDLRVHYAVEPLVNAADMSRRQAEDALWAGEGRDRLEEHVQAARGAAAPLRGYEGAVTLSAALAEGLRLRDEVWACLPLAAEWLFTRGQWNREALASGEPALRELPAATVRLDAACQRLIASRDTQEPPDDLTAQLVRETESTRQLWERLLDALRPAYQRAAVVERYYTRPEDFREAEIALRMPPLADSSPLPLLERYLATLEQWSQQPATSSSAAGAEPRQAAADAPQHSATAGQASSPASISSNLPSDALRTFLRELNRLLDYEFAIPYAQHRHTTDWDTDTPADLIYRRPSQGRPSTWQKIKGLLNRYSAEIQPQPPAWTATTSACQAARPLIAWDRRVRVAAAWLACFDPQLPRPTQPTPTRWLQEYDAAHLAAWQAWRLVGDFWGDGQTPGPTPPFFARACAACEQALPEPLRPLRYDLPGGGLDDLSARSESALARLAAWNPLEASPTIRSSARDAASIELRLAPATSPSAPVMPPGLAVLHLTSSGGTAAGALQVRFDLPTRPPIVPVRLPITEPLALEAEVLRKPPNPAESGPMDVAAQLWFRGHLWRQKVPLPPPGSSSFVEYTVQQPPFAVPTVEVRGQDSLRGAVLFIFDCSASMQAPGRFEVAQSQLAQVLGELARDAGEGLQVGLSVYGRRTKAYGRETDPDLFYRFRSPPDGTPLLTPAGESRRRQMGSDAFFRQFPHPDRDVEELVPVAGGRAEVAQQRLQALRKEECQGCTPLYFAITRALEAGFSLPESDPAVRQIVVVSDGVNMPYDSDDSGIREVGLAVNQRDLEGLRSALSQRRGRYRVSVVLFGGPLTAVEQSQRRALDTLQRDFPDAFELHYAPDVREIARAIRDAFPKSRLELLTSPTQPSGQPLTWNTPQAVAGWPSDGLPRRELERRWVRLRTAGETRRVETELALRGGERVVLQWSSQSRDGRLTLVDDEQIARGGAPLVPPQGLAAPRNLIIEALDPLRSVGQIERLAFRLRDQDSFEKFTPRPWAIWSEITPLEARTPPPPGQVCFDVLWRDNINFPRFEIPTLTPRGTSRVRAQVWVRETPPPPAAQLVLSRGQSAQTPTRPTPGWRVTQAETDDAGRIVTVTWRPAEPKTSPIELAAYAVWVWPPADRVHRRFAQDGTVAIHEFHFISPSSVGSDVTLSWVSADEFRRGAYTATWEFPVDQ